MSNQSSKNNPVNEYAIFGGTFDPVHSGHISAIRYLIPRYPLVIIAPTSQNPWKIQPQATLEQRIFMLRLVLDAEKLSFNLFPETTIGLTLSTFPYTYTEEFLIFARSLLPARPVWAIRKDEVELTKGWKNFEQLNIRVEPLPIEISIHSTDVRQLRTIAHPAIQDFIVKNGLYLAPLAS